MMRKTMILAAVLLIGMVGWRQLSWRKWKQDTLDHQYLKAQVVLGQGVEIGEYDCRFDYRGFRISIAKKECLISRLVAASAGDEVYLYSEIKQPIIGNMDYLRVTGIKVNFRLFSWWSPYWWVRKLEGVRVKMMGIINRSLSEPSASLVSGVVLGQKTEMPEKMKLMLQKTGTTHVVTASGYNLTVVAGVISYGLLLVCSRKQASLIAIGLIWSYVVISGANPPIVRAGIMLSLMLAATSLGRDAWVWWIYGISGLGMIGVSPWMTTSLSFQLSMAATAGVIGSGRITVGKQIQNPIFKATFQTILATLSATLMTAPLILMVFGEVSWLGLVVNPLVLWLIPIITYLGLGMVTLGLIWVELAKVLGLGVTPLCLIWIGLVETAARFPGGVIQMRISWWMVWGWWFIVFSIWRFLIRLEQGK